MDELRTLLQKQYMQYRNRMNYISQHLRWKVIPGYLVPLLKGRR